MSEKRKFYKYLHILIGILILFGLYLTSLYNYLLFHSLAEIFGIVVACGIFMVSINSHRFMDNNYFMFIGIAYLFIGSLDLIHTLAYTGMGVFQGYETNLPTQLWIATRYVESLTLLIAPLLIGRKLKIHFMFFSYTVAVSLLLGSIFYWDVFPVCFVERVGLTLFKKISEYIISLILIASIFLLLRRRKKFDTGVLQLLVASIIVTIFSELAFTFYISAYGLSNLIGHYFKIISFYLIYKAIIETGLTKPYNLLFRNLKLSEDSLREERDKAQKYLDVAGVMLVVIDADRKVSMINKKGCEILGYKEEEIVGKNWFDNFLPERFRDEVKNTFAKLMGGKIKPVEYFENPILTENGEERIIAWHTTVLKDGSGKIIGTLSSGEDITEHKLAEDNLRKYHTAVEQSAVSVVLTDTEGNIEYVNQYFTELTGYSQEEALGKNPRILKTDYHDEAYYKKLWDTITSGNTWRGEFLNKKKNEELYWEAATISPVKDDRDEITHFVGIKENITDRKRVEEQIKDALEEKVVLLREIHHRVKNNMQSLIYLIDMQTDTIETPETLHVLQDLQGRLRAMAMIHEKLYRAENFAQIDFGEYLNDLTANLFHALADGRDIALRVDAADIFTDVNIALPCGMIVNELVTNALKYAFPDPARSDCEIRIAFELQEDEYVLTVSDNGVGLPPELDWHTTESLGLKLVNIWAIYQLRGSIELDTQYGTAFTIKFKEKGD